MAAPLESIYGQKNTFCWFRWFAYPPGKLTYPIQSPPLLSRWFSKLPQVGYVHSLEGTLTAAMYFLLSVIFHLLPSFLHNVPLTGRIPLTKTKALDLEKSLHCTFNTKGKKWFLHPKNFHDFAGFHLALSRISSFVSTVLAGFQQKPTLLPSLS